MNRKITAFILAGVAAGALSLGVSGTAVAATPQCEAAQTAVANSEISLAEARGIRNLFSAEVRALSAQRQILATAGNVAGVGQLNVKIGNKTPQLTTMEAAFWSFTAQLNRDIALRTAAC